MDEPATDVDMMELAREVVACFDDLGGVRMALVTGSVARSIADDRSDLDLLIALDEVDPAIASVDDRLAPVGARRLFALPRGEGLFEKYRCGDRHIDIDYVPHGRLEMTATMLAGGAVDADAMKLAAAVGEAVAIRGAAELSGWQQRLAYGTALARAEVARRGARLVSVEALHELTAARGDAISFARRASGVVLDAIALLGAANRTFIPVEDPKWIPWHLDRLEACPPDAAGRAERALAEPSARTLADLDTMLAEVLDIVDARVPDAETRAPRYALTFRPKDQD